jgi:hypothetical protein
MTNTDRANQHIETASDHDITAVLPPLRHQWPQLGQELFELEHILTSAPDAGPQPSTEQERRAQQADIRNTIIAQVYREEGKYSRDMRYLAFLLLKQGRAGMIVGNPSAITTNGKRQELPYTGLEGYYAGVEKTSDRPGLTSEEIVQEEANIGAQLLKTLKKQAIAQNSWLDLIHLKNTLAWKEQDVEVIRNIQLLWGTVIRRLHVRLYHCPEFEPTLTEQIEHLEQLPGAAQGNTAEGEQLLLALNTTRARFRHALEAMSEAERAQERQERARRAVIRASRIAEFNRFHDETYQILTASHQGHYTLGVQDTRLKDSTITETITLPKIPERQTYPPVLVLLTPAQLEGYLFISRLGEVGGDPLVRSALVTH